MKMIIMKSTNVIDMMAIVIMIMNKMMIMMKPK